MSRSIFGWDIPPPQPNRMPFHFGYHRNISSHSETTGHDASDGTYTLEQLLN